MVTRREYATKEDLDAGLAGIRKDLDAGLAGLRKDLNQDLRSLDNDFERRLGLAIETIRADIKAFGEQRTARSHRTKFTWSSGSRTISRW